MLCAFPSFPPSQKCSPTLSLTLKRNSHKKYFQDSFFKCFQAMRLICQFFVTSANLGLGYNELRKKLKFDFLRRLFALFIEILKLKTAKKKRYSGFFLNLCSKLDSQKPNIHWNWKWDTQLCAFARSPQWCQQNSKKLCFLILIFWIHQ